MNNKQYTGKEKIIVDLDIEKIKEAYRIAYDKYEEGLIYYTPSFIGEELVALGLFEYIEREEVYGVVKNFIFALYSYKYALLEEYISVDEISFDDFLNNCSDVIEYADSLEDEEQVSFAMNFFHNGYKLDGKEQFNQFDKIVSFDLLLSAKIAINALFLRKTEIYKIIYEKLEMINESI